MGNITDNGLKILREKAYFKENESTWEDIADRVSKTISKGETDSNKRKSVRKDIYDAMVSTKFIFSSPCLINANPNDAGQYSSCFIIDLKDNIESIFEAAAKMAKIFQKSGGAGVANISVLRPSNSRVEKSNGYSCGPLEFMNVYNEIADTMTKANKSKRGALKINMDVWHPDIFKFITCKDKDGVLSLMNISVSLYDEFMEAAEKDLDWDLIFPDFENMDKSIYDKEWDGDIYTWKQKGYPVKVYETIKARDLKNAIIKSAWNRGEPGINYQDTMNRANKNKHIGIMIYTNPCNEFSNLPWTSCNLGSLNLVEFITKNGKFDFKSFEKYVAKAVRWLDDMITVNKLPLAEIQKATDDLRPIGLGIMGFGTLLYKLGITYGNNKRCIDFVNKLGKCLSDSAIAATMELAEEKGVYPKWEGSEWSKEGIKVRNSNVISIAPNGTLSTIAGVSGGIEPEFGIVIYRRTNNGNVYYTANPVFEARLKELGIYSEELLEKIANNHGSCQGIEEIPVEIQKVFVTAHDISPEDHVCIVAEFQKYVDLSISKTINFANSASIGDISGIIDMGWKTGCKGLTVYRDGCREFQTLSTTMQEKPKTEAKQEQPVKLSRKEVGRKLEGNTYSGSSACGTFYLTLNRHPVTGQIMESFINIKSGLCKSNVDGLNRMISLALRNGIPMEDVIDQLKGISCSACQNVNMKGTKKLDGISCPDIISKILQEELESQKNNTQKIEPSKIIEDVKYEISATKELEYAEKIKIALEKNMCPDCGAKLEHVVGCIQCYNCGWSKC